VTFDTESSSRRYIIYLFRACTLITKYRSRLCPYIHLNQQQQLFRQQRPLTRSIIMLPILLCEPRPVTTRYSISPNPSQRPHRSSVFTILQRLVSSVVGKPVSICFNESLDSYKILTQELHILYDTLLSWTKCNFLKPVIVIVVASIQMSYSL
jgi:hypothetical protein